MFELDLPEAIRWMERAEPTDVVYMCKQLITVSGELHLINLAVPHP